MTPALYTEFQTRHLQAMRDYPWMRNVEGPSLKDLAIWLFHHWWEWSDSTNTLIGDCKREAQRIHDQCVRQFERTF